MPYKKSKKLKKVGFSQEEWETVCRKAAAAKMTTAAYIRRMAVQGEVKFYDLKDLLNLTRAFVRIGTNINQIAMVANSTNTVTAKDIEDLREQFDYFDRVMKNYLFELTPTVL